MRFNFLKQDIKTTLFVFSAIAGAAVSFSVLYLYHIILIFLILNYVSTRMSCHIHQFKILPTKYYLFFIYILLWFLISLIWTDNLFLGIKYLFYLFCGSALSMYYILYSTNIDKLKHIFRLSALFFIIDITLSFLEVFTDFRWPISKHSFSLSTFGRELFLTKEFLMNNDNDYLFSMPTGFHWNPNSLSAVLCMIFPFFLTYRNSIVAFIGSISIMFLVLSAGARISFWTLTIVFIIYLILYFKRDIYKWILLGAFVFVLTDGFFVFPTNSKKVYEISLISNSTLNKENKRTDNSIQARKELLFKGVSIFSESPILGIGGNGVKHRLKNDDEIKFYDLHFFWLELLVNGGLILLILSGIWYIKLLIKSYVITIKTKNETLSYYSKSVFLALIALVLTAIGPGSMIYNLPMYILFGFTISVINNFSLLKEYNK